MKKGFGRGVCFGGMEKWNRERTLRAYELSPSLCICVFFFFFFFFGVLEHFNRSFFFFFFFFERLSNGAKLC